MTPAITMLDTRTDTMLGPKVYDSGESLVIRRSFWLRLLCVPIFLSGLCCTLGALLIPLCINAAGHLVLFAFTTGGLNVEIVSLSIIVTLPLALGTDMLWWLVKPLELRLYFDEGCYEMRCGFPRFAQTTTGKFSEIDHLTFWNNYPNRYDVSYTVSLIWKKKGLPFMLRSSYNDRQVAFDWASRVAEKLNVPLHNNLRSRSGYLEASGSNPIG